MTSKSDARHDVNYVLKNLWTVLDTPLGEYFADMKLKRAERTAVRRFKSMTVFEFCNNRPYDNKVGMAWATLADVRREPYNHLPLVKMLASLAAGNLRVIKAPA